MRTSLASLLLSVFLCGVAAACGGNVVVDPSAAGTTGATASGTGGVTSTTGSGATSSGTGGASAACPTLAPNQGDACSDPGLVCPVPVCCGGTATCAGGTWQVTSVPCQQPCITCPLTTYGCAANAVCVESGAGGPLVTYRCANDPCAGQPLTCGCAAPLCGQAGCQQASGFLVECNSLGG
jgi:hypothetical protein